MSSILRLLDKKYYKYLLILFSLSYLASLPIYIKKNLVFEAIITDLFIMIIFIYDRKIQPLFFIVLISLDIIASHLIGTLFVKFLLLREFFSLTQKEAWNHQVILVSAIFLLALFENFLRIFYHYPLDFSLEQNLLSLLLLPFLFKLVK